MISELTKLTRYLCNHQSTAKSSDSQSQSRWTRRKSIYGKRNASLGTFGPPKINLMLLPFFLSNGAPLARAFGPRSSAIKARNLSITYRSNFFLIIMAFYTLYFCPSDSQYTLIE